MRSDPVSQFLQSRIEAGDFPSAVYLVAEKGEIKFHDALGYAVVQPERIEARVDTIYDLASLTKPLVTGLLAATRVEASELVLKQTAEGYLPELAALGSPDESGIEYDCLDVSVEELLTHHSGYQAWRPFYLFVDADRTDVKKEILYMIGNRLQPQFEPEIIYSDLNFIMLAGILEKLGSKPLDVIAADEIFGPLGLRHSSFNPAKELRNDIAASEKGNVFEKETCIEQGYLAVDADEIRIPRSAFRTQTIWGEVHDGNAYFMGGVAGHAGLFSTAEEVFKIAQQFLPNYTQLLEPETCEVFRTNFTKGMNEDRSFAFQLASTDGSTAGTRMSPESFGHNGFTGTSLWIDPITERVFILLTNRTHCHELPFVNINSVRRQFHDLAIELLAENK